MQVTFILTMNFIYYIVIKKMELMFRIVISGRLGLQKKKHKMN